MKYRDICKAILKKSGKKDFRPLFRKWIKIFEDTRVAGWNRDEFLECMVKLRKERNDDKKNNKEKM